MGIKNKNGRTYNESEYLPQIEAILKKIDTKIKAKKKPASKKKK